MTLRLSDLTMEEILNLPKGEVVESIAVRSPDFHRVYFENSVIMGTSVDDLVIALLSTEQTNVGYKLVLEDPAQSSAATFGVQSATAKPQLTEQAQLRTAMGPAVDLAFGILEHIRRNHADLLKAMKPRFDAIFNEIEK